MERRKKMHRSESWRCCLWITMWEELHLLVSKEILVDVEHVKAHRTKKDKKEVSHFEKFVTECNEKADELAKERAMLDECFMAKTRAKTLQQEREEVFAALQCAGSFSVWWKNGRTVKGSRRSQKKSEFSWITKERRRNIERRPASIDA